MNRPRAFPRLIATILLCATSNSHASDPLIVPEADSGFRHHASATSNTAMAATANPYASDAARGILANGGSAIDASIAAQLVLGLVEPQSSGIGGGAFLVHWDAADKQLSHWNGRETAPAGVDEKHFLHADGSSMGFFEAVVGGHSVGVPGVIAMLEAAHRQYGKLPWPQLFAPAITLANSGFIISPRLQLLLERTPKLAINPAIRDYFFEQHGKQWRAKKSGTRLKNPAYAEALSRIASHGSAEFYRGQTAQHIVAAVQNDPNHRGPLQLSDMASYSAARGPALCGRYREYQICGAPPPSSGATTVLAIIGMLEALETDEQALQGSDFAHGFIEASRLAFADRSRYLGDPNFVSVPSEGLINRTYLSQRSKLVQRLRSDKLGPGVPPGAPRYISAQSPELPSTSHLSIVDAAGNVASMTSSIETAFGSRIFVDGFLLNNQLSDFSFSPRDNDGHLLANRAAAGKRPRSSMSPIIVFHHNKPLLAIGSPGGARIIHYVAATLYRVLGQGQPLRDAIAAPHIIAFGDTVELEQGRFGDSEVKALLDRGHHATQRPQTSGLHGIWITKDQLIGVADPRREGAARGL
ncbi:MAG: gamma-glutamyltransferase [Spongiibacteraceae bacterium]